MPIICNKDYDNQNFDAILRDWNLKIGPHYGKAFNAMDSNGVEGSGSMKLLQTLVTTQIEKPFHQNWQLDKGQTKRITDEIDFLSRRIKNKGSYINPLTDVLFSSETTSRFDPIARKFVNELDNSDNFKRIHEVTQSRAMDGITKNLRDEFIDRNLQGRYTSLGIPHLRNIDKHQFDITSETSDAEIATQRNLMADFMKSDKALNENQVLTQFIMASEIKSYKKGTPQARAARKSGEIYFEQSSIDGIYGGKFRNVKDSGYSQNILDAAQKTKLYLNDMGNVSLKGLSFLSSAIKEKYTLKGGSIQHRSVDRLLKKIDEAESRLKIGIEDGNYFPRENLMLMYSLREAVYDQISNVNLNIGTGDLSKLDLSKISKTEAIIESIGNVNAIPDHLKGRSSEINKLQNQNPLAVLEAYGTEAIAFNKINHIKYQYIKGVKNIKNADLPYLKGLQQYLTDMYTISTEGISQRTPWVNEINNVLTTLMTVKTMALNATGAVKNLASVINYHATVGLKEVQENNKLYESDPQIEAWTNRAQREEGFLFQDIGKSLLVEGLVSEEQAKSGLIQFDQKTGKITYDGSPIKRNAGIAKDWALDKLLVLHQITENIVRSHIYKNSFIGQLKRYKSQAEYWDEVPEKDHIENSKRFALNMVNNTAFGYAIHNKSKLSRGASIIDKDGSGNVLVRSLLSVATTQTFHMMHYPFSLAERHMRTFIGAGKSLKAGQFSNSDELNHMMRYAVAYAGLQLTDILMNANLSSLADNTTIEMIKGMYSDLTQYNKKDKKTFGVLNRVTGPAPGALEHALNLAGIHGMSKTDLAKMLLGNAELQNKDINEKTLYTIATILGQGYSKYYPSVKAGAGWEVTRHIFNAYPTKFTGKYNSKIMGKKSKPAKKTNNPFNVKSPFSSKSSSLMADLEKIKGTA